MVLQHHLVFVWTFALDSEERVVKQNADISTHVASFSNISLVNELIKAQEHTLNFHLFHTV